MQKSILLSFLVFLSGVLAAQSIVSVNEQQVVPVATLAFFFGGGNVEYSVRVYKVNYTTIDVFGQPTEASGMLSVPFELGSDEEPPAFPLAVYNHGTVNDREAVPSREGVSERNLVNILASNGYVTLAPDYLGLGDNPGLHPYVHAESEAQAGYDMLLAVRQWLQDEEIAFNDQLFTTGYSQGGHASMALQQKLQEDPTDLLPVLTAGAHLSGPYSIGDVMKGVLFDPNTETLPGYLAYTYISYNFVYGLYDSLDQVFVPPFVAPIEQFAAEEINLGELNLALFGLLAATDTDLPDMFQDSILDIFQNQPDHPINVALNENDTYNFAPESPTLLVYCTQDEQVPFQNALLADSVMTEVLGSDQVELFNGGPENHGGCVSPAILRAIEFFESFSLLNSVFAPEAVGSLSISPNPLPAGGQLRLAEPTERPLDYQLTDLSGRSLYRGRLPAGADTFTLPDLPRGAYYLLTRGQRSTTNKIIIN